MGLVNMLTHDLIGVSLKVKGNDACLAKAEEDEQSDLENE